MDFQWLFVFIVVAVYSAESLKPLHFYIFEGGLCPFAGRTWIVFGELDELDFEFCYVGFQQKSPEFLKVNPRGRVPALYNPNDDTTVYESTICNEYLCDLAADSNSSMMPVSASGRAKLRLLNDKFDKDIFPKVRAYIMSEKDDDTCRLECEQSLEDLQETLGKGPYFMGDTFTVADAHIIPFVMRWIAQLKHTKNFDLPGNYPNLMNWYQLCQTRPSVQAATIDEDKIIEVHYAKLKHLKEKLKDKTK